MNGFWSKVLHIIQLCVYTEMGRNKNKQNFNAFDKNFVFCESCFKTGYFWTLGTIFCLSSSDSSANTKTLTFFFSLWYNNWILVYDTIYNTTIGKFDTIQYLIKRMIPILAYLCYGWNIMERNIMELLIYYAIRYNIRHNYLKQCHMLVKIQNEIIPEMLKNKEKFKLFYWIIEKYWYSLSLHLLLLF